MPRPSMNRPRLMLSISAAMRAIRAGWRYGTQLTTEPHALCDPGQCGDTDPGIGLHRRMVEDETAIEPERFDPASGVQQPAQSLVAEDELNTPADAVIGLGDPWVARHALLAPSFRRPLAPVRQQPGRQGSNRVGCRWRWRRVRRPAPRR